ncbi:universal stress protein [Georgenia sp. 10Sc9-8]|uniref:Universal stress protein n=1 Tax=Georgenia halotolerans TaxID=3028317 RepID=A0ABT5TTK5_9MICO|nr:universal stress protein [Georgenia halotolerans]
MSIVVGYIPTPEGRAALRASAEEAKLRGTRLVVVNSQPGGRQYDEHEARRFEDELATITRTLDQIGVESEVRTLVRGKDPSEDLLSIAAECDARLIVIGLRRRSPVGKLILGSNAQELLLKSTCPVLAVKADATDRG